MKKLVFGLIATVMFGFFGNAQVSRQLIDLQKQFGPLVNHEFPSSLRTTTPDSDDIHTIVLGKKDNCIVVFLDENGIQNISSSKSVPISRESLVDLQERVSSLSTGKDGERWPWWKLIRIVVEWILDQLDPNP
jgi:hypothetical protein